MDSFWNKPNLLTIAKTKDQRLLVAFSSQPMSNIAAKPKSTDFGFLMRIEANGEFEKYRSVPDKMLFQSSKNHISYGMSDFKIPFDKLVL